jgi:HD-GYP domain-containing protein (c-di-GMP phosphodiesterase class II)
MNAHDKSQTPERPDQALVSALTAAIRTASYYDSDNAVMQQACSTLASRLADYHRQEDTVTVGVHSHCVFLGRTRVRTTASDYARFAYLVQLFEAWHINTLTFEAGVAEQELLQLSLVLARERPTEVQDLAELLAARGVRRIQVDLLLGEAAPQAVAPVEAYAAAVQMTRQLSEQADSQDITQARRLRHVTQAVVDQILREPASLVALTTIKDFDRYLISHSTNVAVLAVVLGQRLGLSKSRLGELCLAAFLHDAGKLEITPEVLHKPGSLDEAEWEEIRRHPVLAAYTILGTGRYSPSLMRAVVVAFEHHLREDLSGYPPLFTGLKRRMTLFGSIVAIADCYDALTTARVYRDYNLTPHEALLYLIANAGTHFDPALVKMFVEIMGLYPPGTLVELTTGETGVVCAAPALGTDHDRPQVRLLTGDRAGEVVDLGERVDGEFPVSVKHVLNPSNKGQLPAVDLSLLAHPAA